MRVFARVHRPDQRDLQYPFRRRKATRTSRYWNDRWWRGDQGTTSACVGFAWAGWLACSPRRQFLDPQGVYALAKQNDEWKGENYEGTSVRGGVQVLQKLGFVEEYTWATSVDDVVNALLTTGPVVVGTWWLDDMTTPVNGVMSVSGAKVGGHAYLLTGANERTGTVRVTNSWGREWGTDGHATMSIGGLAGLLADDGEACVAIERTPAELMGAM